MNEQQPQTLAGGAIRVPTVASSDQQSIPEPGPFTKVHGGVVRSVAGQGVETSGIIRHVESRDGVPGGSVLATLNRVGQHVTVELVPGVPGTRTHVETAIREGLLTRASDGSLLDARTADGQQRSMMTQDAPQQEGPAEPPRLLRRPVALSQTLIAA